MLPATTECAEEVDLCFGHLRVRSGEVGFCICQGSFGVQHNQKVDSAFAQLGTADAGGDPRLLRRLPQRFPFLECVGVGRERGFGFLQRAQHRPVKSRQRGQKFGASWDIVNKTLYLACVQKSGVKVAGF